MSKSPSGESKDDFIHKYKFSLWIHLIEQINSYSLNDYPVILEVL
jgi:hypothetical protein